MSRKFKHYISPSTQERNLYAGGGNEEQYMRIVAGKAATILNATGKFDIRVGGSVSAAANVADANSWGADSYSAAHTNAASGQTLGTVGFYFVGSNQSKALAQAIYDEVARVSPGKDLGLRSGNHLIEVNGTKMPATLIELEFHDSLAGATHIKNNLNAYAAALARGIAKYHGVDLNIAKPAPAEREFVVVLAHLAIGDIGKYTAWANARGAAFWPVACRPDPLDVDQTHTEGLATIASGVSVAKTFGSLVDRHAVFAAHCDVRDADSFISLAVALGDAHMEYEAGQVPAGAPDHTTALAQMLTDGRGVAATFPIN